MVTVLSMAELGIVVSMGSMVPEHLKCPQEQTRCLDHVFYHFRLSELNKTKVLSVQLAKTLSLIKFVGQWGGVEGF